MSLLVETLRFAIPMWRLEMADWDKKRIEDASHECAQLVAEKGDCLMFKSKGNTRTAFNAMAQGMACLEILAPDCDTAAMLARIEKDEKEFFGDVGTPRSLRP